MTQPTTLAEMYFEAVLAYPKPNRFLGKRGGRYEAISTQTFAQKVEGLCLGSHALGLRKGDKIAILSYNRPEWAMTDYAILTLGGVTVPIYTTLTASQCAYILRDAEAKAIVVENEEQLQKILSVRDELKTLHFIVSIEPCAKQAENHFTLEEIIQRGNEEAKVHPKLHRRYAAEVWPEDLATLIYTSGTTGVPKGVMLTHQNLLSNVLTLVPAFDFTLQDIGLSFLPLSHVFERIVDYTLFYRGATIAYAESIEKVSVNLKEVQPTVMAAVPRFYEKIYSQMSKRMEESAWFKRQLFSWARKVGQRYASCREKAERPTWALRDSYVLADQLVFHKVKKALGGRIRFLISGGAALSPEIARFFYEAGILVLQGYGLTETSPVVCTNTVKHNKFGTVGRPLEGVEVKIASDGEILVRGANVMVGYYQKPEETEATYKDGWLATGDIGSLDGDGFLTILDRKKDMIKTSGGKYVAPQPLEGRLKMSPYIANAAIVGNARKFVSALVVPNFEALQSWLKGKGTSLHSPSEIAKHPETHRLVQEAIDKVNSTLAPFETIKKFILLGQDFSVTEGELTPTLKLRRRIIEEKYKAQINGLYRE